MRVETCSGMLIPSCEGEAGGASGAQRRERERATLFLCSTHATAPLAVRSFCTFRNCRERTCKSHRPVGGGHAFQTHALAKPSIITNISYHVKVFQLFTHNTQKFCVLSNQGIKKIATISEAWPHSPRRAKKSARIPHTRVHTLM